MLTCFKLDGPPAQTSDHRISPAGLSGFNQILSEQNVFSNDGNTQKQKSELVQGKSLKLEDKMIPDGQKKENKLVKMSLFNENKSFTKEKLKFNYQLTQAEENLS